MSNRGRPPGHTPANKGKALPGTKKPARTASRVVKQMFNIIDEAGISAQEVGKTAGVHYVSISRWKHGYACPRVIDIENVAQAIGYRLELVPMDDGKT